jgi:hypothetical protein
MKRSGRAFLCCIALASLSSGGTEAQQLTGRVLDEATGAPVHGAFVSLLAGSAVVARGLVDERGLFRVQPPGAGSYVLSIERIGYSTYRSDVIALAAGDTVHRELRIPAHAIALDAVEVESVRRCTGATRQTAVLWEEARKALSIAAWVNESGRVRYEIRLFERALDPAGRRVLWEDAHTEEFLHDRSPFRTWPVEDLLVRGFVHRDTTDGSWLSWGPGAEGLLSEAFLDAHCFQSVESRDEPGLIGLGFTPIRVQSATGIAGYLWLDRASYELRRIDFHYVRSPWDVPPAAAGGRIEYERLASGVWIVSSWVLRSPIMEGRRLRGISEGGREVVGA